MALIEPKTPSGNFLREKIVLIGGGGSGKTSGWASFAWWAKQADDPRVFHVMDTDDEAVMQVFSEEKYRGLLAEEGGNVHVTSVVTWDDYQAFSDKAVANAKKGDWIVLDFVSHAWAGAQDGFMQDALSKSRDEALYEAGVKGAKGWDLFKEAEMNWVSITSAYSSFIKPILLASPAHVFMTAEEEEIREGSGMTDEAKHHISQFGRWKAMGAQKKLPYQCRTFLRVQRLARGRVLYTLKDRARPEHKGDTFTDLFTTYLKGSAGWTIE